MDPTSADAQASETFLVMENKGARTLSVKDVENSGGGGSIIKCGRLKVKSENLLILLTIAGKFIEPNRVIKAKTCRFSICKTKDKEHF